MAEQPDYYEVLQVSPNADQEIIQVAYRRLAQKWHPDRQPGDRIASEQMTLLNAAYEVLSNPQQRREYDLWRSQSAASRGTGDAVKPPGEQQYRKETDRKHPQEHGAESQPWDRWTIRYDWVSTLLPLRNNNTIARIGLALVGGLLIGAVVGVITSFVSASQGGLGWGGLIGAGVTAACVLVLIAALVFESVKAAAEVSVALGFPPAVLVGCVIGVWGSEMGQPTGAAIAGAVPVGVLTVAVVALRSWLQQRRQRGDAVQARGGGVKNLCKWLLCWVIGLLVTWPVLLFVRGLMHSDSNLFTPAPPRSVIRVLSGHKSDVLCVAYSLDGERLASGSFDGEVKLWDAGTGKELSTMRGHLSSVNGVAFSPDGSALVTVSFDKTVRIWDTLSGRPVHTLQGHTQPIRCVSFSPNGRYVATAGRGNHTPEENVSEVKTWDLMTGTEHLSLASQTKQVDCVAFSPDGRYLACAGGEQGVVKEPGGEFVRGLKGEFVLWDVVTGVQHSVVKEFTSPVERITFSPDGHLLLTTHYEIHWNEPHPPGLNPRGQSLAKIWDVATGKCVGTFSGHTLPALCVGFGSGGRHVVSASSSDVLVWDAATGGKAPFHRLQLESVRSVGFRPDGKRMATGRGRGEYDATKFRRRGNEIRIWDISPGFGVISQD